MLTNEALLAIEDTSDEVKDLARQSIQAATQGAELTRALLAYARRQPLEPQRVDVCALVDTTLQMIERTLGKTIQLHIEREPGPLFTLVDPSKLQHAISNLALNARDAMPDGGQLNLRCWGTAEWVHIVVHDEGHGIPQANLERVFDPFFTTKRQDTGTGLGLSTVHGFLHQSDGSIEVASTLGEGTTFHVRLPAALQA